jgi:hypothetical protein
MSKRMLASMFIVLGLLSFSGVSARGAGSPEGWQNEFEEICSQTQDAMVFTTQQLETLVRRCDALAPQIEKLDETRKKVYLTRLRQCRGVFTYVLDSKHKDGK